MAGRTARCRLARQRSLEDPVALMGGSESVWATHFPLGSWRMATLTSTGRPSYRAFGQLRLLQRPTPRSREETTQPAAVTRHPMVGPRRRPKRQWALSKQRCCRPEPKLFEQRWDSVRAFPVVPVGRDEVKGLEPLGYRLALQEPVGGGSTQPDWPDRGSRSEPQDTSDGGPTHRARLVVEEQQGLIVAHVALDNRTFVRIA